MTETRRRLNPNAEAGRWNAAHPVGTPVEVRRDNGDLMQTVTRSEAWVLSGHTAVVMVDGISGGYLLNRVRATKGAVGSEPVKSGEK